MIAKLTVVPEEVISRAFGAWEHLSLMIQRGRGKSECASLRRQSCLHKLRKGPPCMCLAQEQSHPTQGSLDAIQWQWCSDCIWAVRAQPYRPNGMNCLPADCAATLVEGGVEKRHSRAEITPIRLAHALARAPRSRAIRDLPDPIGSKTLQWRSRFWTLI